MADAPSKRTPRRRRTAEEAKAEALREARRLLLAEGPQAVTLKGVAAPLGVSHVNLIHHFGSAEGLQTALMESMAADLRHALADKGYVVQPGDGSARRLVDIVFDAFGQGGAGKLVAWMSLSGDRTAMERITAMAATLAQDTQDPEIAPAQQAANFATLTSMALADSLAGDALRQALNLPADGLRDLAAQSLLDVLGRPRP